MRETRQGFWAPNVQGSPLGKRPTSNVQHPTSNGGSGASRFGERQKEAWSEIWWRLRSTDVDQCPAGCVARHARCVCSPGADRGGLAKPGTLPRQSHGLRLRSHSSAQRHTPHWMLDVGCSMLDVSVSTFGVAASRPFFPWTVWPSLAALALALALLSGPPPRCSRGIAPRAAASFSRRNTARCRRTLVCRGFRRRRRSGGFRSRFCRVL